MKPNYNILALSTITIGLSAWVVSSCGGGADGSGSNVVSKNSLAEFTALTAETGPSDLSDTQLKASLLFRNLLSRKYFVTPEGNYNYTLKGADLARPCPMGGEIAVQNSEASAKQTRTSDTSSEYSGTIKSSVLAKDCNLLTKRNYVESEDSTAENVKYEVEAISAKHRYSVSGSADLSSSISGTVARLGGVPISQYSKNSPDYEFIVSHSATGKVNLSVPADDTSVTHAFDLTNYSVAYLARDEDRKELREIAADPLGSEQVRERKVEFFSNRLKCKGVVKIDNLEFPCAPFTKRMIIEMVNGEIE